MERSMNRARVALTALSLVIGAAAPAFAHHSAQMFNFTKRNELSGVVKQIRVINPHMSLTLEIMGDNGTAKDIAFEGHSVNNFYRAGWRPNMVKVGDHIKVEFAPRKDGQDGGFVVGFTTAQGQEIGFKLPGAEAAPASAASATKN
jgi:Family of unknown function (DUF6152)